MVTIKDVARKAGLSICTVSRSLAGKDKIRPETRERVIEAARELNYKPNMSARSLKTGSTLTLGLLIPDVMNPCYPKLAKCIELYAEKCGYMVFFCNANEDVNRERQLVESLKTWGVDGVIVLPCSGDIAHFDSFRDAGIPYVFLDRKFGDMKNCISTDNFYGAWRMTKYVISMGHSNISAAFPSFENQIYKERYEGTLKALKEHGLSHCAGSFLFNLKDMQDAWRKTCKLLQSPEKPTAIVAASDMLCLAIYGASRTCGLQLPKDLSVTGYGDAPIASMIIPPLTTYRQDEEELARRSVDYLLSCIDGAPIPCGQRLQGEIVIRQSVGRV